jgi:transposase
MIEALIAGERDPDVLANLARTRMRAKIAALREALVDRSTDHHAFPCQAMLGRIDHIDATIARLSSRIQARTRRVQAALDRLDTIPWVNQRIAEVLIAEMAAICAASRPRHTWPPGRNRPREQRARR